MNGHSSSKSIIAALEGNALDRPPFWFMRQAGRFLPEYRRVRGQVRDFLELCYSPKLAAEVTLQPVRRFDTDGAILFSDILVVPHALGRGLKFVEGTGPLLEAVRSPSDLEGLDVGNMLSRLQSVFETVERVVERLDADVTMIGFAGAPWTVAVYMVEGCAGSDCGLVKRWAYGSPQTFQQLIQILIDATVLYLRRQAESGVEMVQLFDSWAGVLNETQFERWVVEPTAEIVRRFKTTCPHVPIVGFARGAGLLHRVYALKTGLDGISIDSGVPLGWARSELQSACTVQGNLDNQVLVCGGDILETETRRILDALAGGPFIFNLGHGILPDTPVENVAALSRTLRGWRRG